MSSLLAGPFNEYEIDHCLEDEKPSNNHSDEW